MFLAELQPQEKKAFLELAYLVASADGHLTPKEEALLEEYKKEMVMEESHKIENLSFEKIVSQFQSERSKNIALTELLSLIFSDGVYHEEERKSIQMIKEHFGFNPNQFNSFKDWVENIRKLSQ